MTTRQLELLFQFFVGFSTFIFLNSFCFFPVYFPFFSPFLPAVSPHPHCPARPRGPAPPRLAPTSGPAFLLATSDARGAANGAARGAAGAALGTAGGQRGRSAQPARRGTGTMAGAGRCLRACGLAWLLLCCAARRDPAGEPGRRGRRSAGALRERRVLERAGHGRCDGPSATAAPSGAALGAKVQLGNLDGEAKKAGRSRGAPSRTGAVAKGAAAAFRCPWGRPGRASAFAPRARAQEPAEPWNRRRSARCFLRCGTRAARLARQEAGGKVSRRTVSCKPEPLGWPEIPGNKLSFSLSCTSCFLYPMIVKAQFGS